MDTGNQTSQQNNLSGSTQTRESFMARVNDDSYYSNLKSYDELVNAANELTKELKDYKSILGDADLEDIRDRLAQLNSQIDDLTKSTPKTLAAFNAASEAISGNFAEAMKILDKSNIMSFSAEAIKTAGLVTAIAQAVSDALGSIGDALWGIADFFTNAINTGISNYTTYMGAINARMYGYGQNLQDNSNNLKNYYTEFTDVLREGFSQNSYVLQTDLLKNINSLVGQGIAWNVEERAYLETIASSTVTTFSILNNETLNRLIRVQQEDISVAMMGAESLLTKFLNSQYKDTSFLNSLYDSVYSALTDANSLKTASDSVVWSLAVEQWMGALYSVGLSQESVSNLASGINSLATGDISKLAGNDSLNTLLAMSAANANLSYSDLLTNGLDVSNTNDLLMSVISTLQNIANNTDNNVLKSAWSDVLGVSLSDFRAIQNLTKEDLDQIKNSVSGYTFGGTVQELANQINIMQSDVRTSQAAKISNALDNMMYSIGSTVAETPEFFKTWTKANVYKSISESLPLDLFDIGKNITSVITGIQVAGMLDDAVSKAFGFRPAEATDNLATALENAQESGTEEETTTDLITSDVGSLIQEFAKLAENRGTQIIKDETRQAYISAFQQVLSSEDVDTNDLTDLNTSIENMINSVLNQDASNRLFMSVLDSDMDTPYLYLPQDLRSNREFQDWYEAKTNELVNSGELSETKLGSSPGDSVYGGFLTAVTSLNAEQLLTGFNGSYNSTYNSGTDWATFAEGTGLPKASSKPEDYQAFAQAVVNEYNKVISELTVDDIPEEILNDWIENSDTAISDNLSMSGVYGADWYSAVVAARNSFITKSFKDYVNELGLSDDAANMLNSLAEGTYEFTGQPTDISTGITVTAEERPTNLLGFFMQYLDTALGNDSNLQKTSLFPFLFTYGIEDTENKLLDYIGETEQAITNAEIVSANVGAINKGLTSAAVAQTEIIPTEELDMYTPVEKLSAQTPAKVIESASPEEGRTIDDIYNALFESDIQAVRVKLVDIQDVVESLAITEVRSIAEKLLNGPIEVEQSQDMLSMLAQVRAL